MQRIVVVRSWAPRHRILYYFDGARFLSCAQQEPQGEHRQVWRNVRRWVGDEAPAVPKDVMAEAKARVRTPPSRDPSGMP